MVGTIFRQLVLMLLASLYCLVGFSRVYLGEHWVSDLPGSYLLGGVWLALVSETLSRLDQRATTTAAIGAQLLGSQ